MGSDPPTLRTHRVARGPAPSFPSPVVNERTIRIVELRRLTSGEMTSCEVRHSPFGPPHGTSTAAYCLGSRGSPTGPAGGNMLSYSARASRTKRARSSSGFGINRTTSPISAPRQVRLRQQYMRTSCQAPPGRSLPKQLPRRLWRIVSSEPRSRNQKLPHETIFHGPRR